MTARKIIFRALTALLAFCFLAVILINALVYALTLPYISPKEEKKPDYVLILGAGLNRDGSPGRMLRDRLNTAISIYQRYQDEKEPPILIVSGDRTLSENKSYDEVTAMRTYLLKKGIPENSVIEDPLGFSTAESIANLQTLEKGVHIAVVTQEYHLYRALFIAYMNDYSVAGYAAPPYDDGLMFFREMREIAARVKDFLFSASLA